MLGKDLFLKNNKDKSDTRRMKLLIMPVVIALTPSVTEKVICCRFCFLIHLKFTLASDVTKPVDISDCLLAMNLNNLSICRIHVVSLQNELVFTYKSPEKFGAFLQMVQRAFYFF